MRGADATRNQRLVKMLNKVPEVTLYFWIIKILATTVGETAADFLDSNLGIGTAAGDLTAERLAEPAASRVCAALPDRYLTESSASRPFGQTLLTTA